MELKQLKKYEPIYVIGHSNIDIDSAVASKILSDVLNGFGIKAYYAVLEEKYNFDAQGMRYIGHYNGVRIDMNTWTKSIPMPDL